MTFDIEQISFQLGEEKFSVEETCISTGRDFKRLISKTGFENVYRTKLSEQQFFGNFLTKELKIRSEDSLIFVNQGMSSLIPGKVPSLFEGMSNFNNTLFIELSDGCTGFVRAIILANALLSSKSALRVHVICAEKYSAYFLDSDSAVAPIFSDAISLTTLVSGSTYNLIASSVNNSFEKAELISTYRDQSGTFKLRMDGSFVLAWAMNQVPSNLEVLFEKSGLTKSEIDAWYFHQGSKVMIEMLADKIGLENDGLFSAAQIGNTTSSSIPIALSQAIELRKIRQSYGENIVLVGFGVGLSIVSALIRVNP